MTPIDRLLVRALTHLIDAFGKSLSGRLDRIEHTLEKLMTQAHATQEQIDTLTAQVTDADNRIQAAVQALRDEIARLQGEGVDVTELQAAVDHLTADANADAGLDAG